MSTETSNDDTSTSEKMAAEAVKPKKPRGAPNLWPFQALPRRQRAQFLKAFGKVQERSEKLAELDKKAKADGDEEQVGNLGDLADVYDLMADLEDALRLAAKDTDAFDKWVAGCTDNDLSALSQWYMERFDVGEASASSA